MSWLRLAWRLPALCLLCLPVAIGTALGRLLGPSRGAWIRDRASRAFGRGVLAILGARLTVDGDVPRAPYALISNHLSYLDVVVLLAVLSRPRFVSKAEVRAWPLLGPLARLGRTLFLQRERVRELPSTVRAMHDALDDGDGLVLFPEGTSSGGEGLLPFRPSLFAPFASLRFPLHCASLRYLGPRAKLPPSEWLCWWRDMPFAPHFLRVVGGPGFRVELRFATDTLVGEDRKLLAAASERAVRAIFTPTASEASMVDLGPTMTQHRKLLTELDDLLAKLPPELYGAVQEPVPSDGVGTHLRHVLGFYECLFAALRGDGLVDYDARSREAELENSPQRARERVAEYRAQLESLREDRPLRVVHDRVGDDEAASATSLSRELRFVASHSVHHFAIVAMILRFRGYELPDDFGVAPSTLTHRARLGIASH